MRKCVFTVGIVCLSVASVAMPTKKELKDVQGFVGELMADDVAARKAGKMTASEVAAKAEAYARDAETEAARFLLLKGAFGYYMQGEDYGEALRVLNVLTTTVKDIPDKVVAEIVVAKLKRISKKKGTPIFEYYERLERRMSMTEERAKLEKAVKENPSSQEACHDLAVCLAVLGEWPAALGHFAKVGGKEAEAAAAEKAGKTAEAANLWWEAAQGDSADTLRAHAAALYRQAIAENKLTGLKLTLAKKRLAEVEPEPQGETASVPSAAAASPAADASAKPEAEKTVVQVPARNGKYDWSIPDRLDGVRSLDFDLGCPDKMRFFAVAPGEVTRSGVIPVPYQITRPFWLSQCEVTLEQYKALGLTCKASKIDELAKACKGDPSVAVLAPVSYDEQQEFYRKLNAKFGHLLPKGLVFRPITLAEMGLVHWNRNRNPKGYVPAGLNVLATLKQKGFYQDADDVFTAIRKYNANSGSRFLPHAVQPDYAKLKASQKPVDAVLYRALCVLDTISTPDNDEGAPLIDNDCIVDVLKKTARRENPFWYSHEKAPNRRFIMGNCRLWFLGAGRSIIPRVVVGYDYVGEWQRLNGK